MATRPNNGVLGGPVTIHVVQDIATPHNNSLISELRSRPGVDVVEWYATRRRANLPWKNALSGGEATRFFDNARDRAKLLLTAAFRRRDHFLVVGYTSRFAAALVVVLCAARKRYLMWSDLPVDTRGSLWKRARRWIAYKVVRASVCRILAVGGNAVQHFVRAGFEQVRVSDFPVVVSLSTSLKTLRDNKQAVRRRFAVPSDTVLICAGSRLVYDKGYDLLLTALALLRPETRVLLESRDCRLRS